MSQNQKIIFAIDPFAKLPALARAARSVTTMARQGKFKVQVASVISPAEVKWPEDFNGEWESEFQKLATTSLNKLSKKLKLPSGLAPKTVMQLFHSTKTSAQSILDLAKKQHAGMIVAPIHVKNKGRVFEGSFVESLIGLSSLPVLAVNAKAKPLRHIKSILFPTDYSTICLKSFKKTVDFAAKIGAKIVVFHNMTSPTSPDIIDGSPMAGGWVNVEKFFRDHEKKIQKKALAWEKMARAKGVLVTSLVNHGTANTENLIMDASKKNKIDLIVMTAQTGRIASVFLGSITKAVLRSSKQPVLIMKGH